MTYRIGFRYLVSLLSNFLRIFIVGITGIVTARSLGPAAYGTVNYLLSSFSSVFFATELGTSSSFYTFIASTKRGIGFYSIFFTYTALRYVVVFAFVLVVPAEIIRKFWPQIPSHLLYWGLTAAFFTYHFWTIVQQIGEAARETVYVQKIRIYMVAFNLILVSVLAVLGKLTITSVFVSTVVSYLFWISYFLIGFNWKEHVDLSRNEKIGAVFAEFVSYSGPLAVVTVVTLIFSFVNRWMLQTFSGATQQGFFSVGEQLAAVIVVCINSLSNIFWKEIAHENANQNHARVYNLFQRARITLYFSTSALACFIVVFLDKLVPRLLGAAYSNALPAITLMVLYPIPAALGQLNTAYMYATGRTKAEMYFISAFAILNSACMYFALAPVSALLPGFGMGAKGSALVPLLVCVFITNIESRYIARLNNWENPVYFQVKYPIVLFVLAFAAYHLTSGIPDTGMYLLARISIGLAFYLSGIIIFILYFDKTLKPEAKKVKDLVMHIVGAH